MSIKYPLITAAAAAIFAVSGAVSASAQDNCGFMYQRVMEAYQVQSPHYGEMLQHYTVRCLSGSSQPSWGANYRYRYDNDHHGYDRSRWRSGE